MNIAIGRRKRKVGNSKQSRPGRDCASRFARAVETAAGLDHARPLCRQELEAAARALLAGLALPECYVGWTMVTLASAFWQEQVAAVPYARRLVLLPRCLRSRRRLSGGDEFAGTGMPRLRARAT